ncbi:hypothetical protein D9M71_719260 [compost metagenome]
MLRIELTLLEIGAKFVQFLLAGPEPCQLFKPAQLLAIVLQQAAENLDLFSHRFGLGTGLFVKQFQVLLLLGQFFAGLRRTLFKRGQFCLALVQAIAHQHQLLQAIAVGMPGIAQRGQ